MADGNTTTGTVLVIDDEQTVLMIASSILESDGYDVCSAGGGREGLSLFKEREEEIVAVVLDLTMPGLSGAEVYRQLRALKPDLPILLSSGYSEQDALEELKRDGRVAFLHKPYRANQLRDAVSQLVQQAREPD